jgi:ElaA protein
MAKMKWYWLHIDDMSSRELYALLAMRVSIFVVEQDCPYPELDNLDQDAAHLVGYLDGDVAACLRLLPPGINESRVRIGRVAVAPEVRATGLARKMMKMAIDRAADYFPGQPVFVSAQTYLRDFYLSLGFVVSGDEYLEDGIPHLPMTLDVSG